MKTRRSSRPRPAAAPRLPHDRDESPETEGAPRAILVQAAGDIEAGRVDTDNYTRARELTRHALRRRTRR